MRTVAVDAMGGDHAPAPEVEGAVAAVRERIARVVLVGDEARVRGELVRLGADGLDGLTVRHASEVIRMEDHPAVAAKGKKDSSMRVAFDLAKEGEVDAVVSAGNSGAMLACGLFVMRRLRRRRAARHRDHVPDGERRLRAHRHGRQRRVPAGDAGAVRGARRGLRAPPARQGAAEGGPPVERRGGDQGHRADARRPQAARRPAATRTSSSSATSRGATSSAARSTSSSPTASPATSCSRPRRARRRRSTPSSVARSWRRRWARLARSCSSQPSPGSSARSTSTSTAARRSSVSTASQCSRTARPRRAPSRTAFASRPASATRRCPKP